MNLSDSRNSHESDDDNHGTDSPQLAVSVNSAVKGLNVPLTCLEGIWRKATELINNNSAIVAAPGQNEEARMVLSHSHLVTPLKGGGFSCDANCPSWKSTAICSHTIAVAQVNGKLPQFISYLRKKKVTPNITKLVTSNMPRGRGRKGSVPPRKRKLQVPECQ